MDDLWVPLWAYDLTTVRGFMVKWDWIHHVNHVQARNHVLMIVSDDIPKEHCRYSQSNCRVIVLVNHWRQPRRVNFSDGGEMNWSSFTITDSAAECLSWFSTTKTSFSCTEATLQSALVALNSAEDLRDFRAWGAGQHPSQESIHSLS